MHTVAAAAEGWPFVPPSWAPSVLVPLTGLALPAVSVSACVCGLAAVSLPVATAAAAVCTAWARFMSQSVQHQGIWLQRQLGRQKSLPKPTAVQPAAAANAYAPVPGSPSSCLDPLCNPPPPWCADRHGQPLLLHPGGEVSKAAAHACTGCNDPVPMMAHALCLEC